MRYAIFSDVHNNTEALNLVLRDAAAKNVGAYLCLGDTGGDPCVNRVRDARAAAVFGNWEVSGWRHLSPANQRWTLSLPPVRKYTNFWISHAAPGWPEKVTSLESFNRYRHRIGLPTVFPYYLAEGDDLWRAFSELLAAEVPILFHGHTHRQQVWCFTAENEAKKRAATNFALIPGETYITGVGSVGQPKDIPKPAYVIFDSQIMSVEFIRPAPLP